MALTMGPVVLVLAAWVLGPGIHRRIALHDPSPRNQEVRAVLDASRRTPSVAESGESPSLDDLLPDYMDIKNRNAGR